MPKRRTKRHRSGKIADYHTPSDALWLARVKLPFSQRTISAKKFQVVVAIITGLAFASFVAGLLLDSRRLIAISGMVTTSLFAAHAYKCAQLGVIRVNRRDYVKIENPRGYTVMLLLLVVLGLALGVGSMLLFAQGGSLQDQPELNAPDQPPK